MRCCAIAQGRAHSPLSSCSKAARNRGRLDGCAAGGLEPAPVQGYVDVIRTNKIPFLQSRASWRLTLTTLSIMAIGMWLPYSPVAAALGFTHLPRLYWPI